MKTMSKIKSVLSVSLLTLAVGGLLAFWSAFSRDVSLGIEVTSSGEPIAGKASVSTLQKTYEAWAEGYKGTDPAGPVVTVMWNRGLSSEYSPAKGIAQLDLAQNKISVRITGLFDTNISDVWLVDNQPAGIAAYCPKRATRWSSSAA
jgi:hypothetical protein